MGRQFGWMAGVLLLAAHAAAQTVPDVNCDSRVSAADYTAAITVSYDEQRFPGCGPADDYRGRLLVDADFVPITRAIFSFFDAPWTPTPTATRLPTRTRTSTRTRTATRTPTATRTVTLTRTVTQTRTVTSTPSPAPTNTVTPTRTPTSTPTPASTSTITQTRTPTITRTPTGIAQRISGRWAADWQNNICFLAGQPFTRLFDVIYRVTAINGDLDIVAETPNGQPGQIIGRSLDIENPEGSSPYQVLARLTIETPEFCPNGGRRLDFVFNYTFSFGLDGFGQARAEWTYASGSFCATCSVIDFANLRRIPDR